MKKEIKVGYYEKKTASKLNRELYKSAESVLGDNMYTSHIGWSGVGMFIDWLEENYEITRKVG